MIKLELLSSCSLPLNAVNLIERDEGVRNYSYKRQKIQKLDRMKNIDNLLRNQGFQRIHKSFIVSIKKIDATFGNVLEINNMKLPIGRSYKDEINQVLGMGE